MLTSVDFKNPLTGPDKGLAMMMKNKMKPYTDHAFAICPMLTALSAGVSFFSVILAYSTMKTIQAMLPKMAGVSAPMK